VATIETIRVPDIGEFDEVDIVEVLVSPGDEISEGDSLITLESDKASLDVPSPYSGVVQEVLVAVDDKVGEGTPIATIEVDSESVRSLPPAGRSPTRPPPVGGGVLSEEDLRPAVEVPSSPTDESLPPAADVPSSVLPQGRMPLPSDTPRQQDTYEQAISPSGGGRMGAFEAEAADPESRMPHASPSVRKLARELGADLGRVSPSGPKGRILAEDVKVFVRAELSRPTPSSTVSPVPLEDFTKFGEIELEPLNKIRKLTARNMAASWRSVPQVTQHDEADVTELEEFRKSLAEEADRRGLRLSPLAFLITACARALVEFPRFNSSLDPTGENLVLKKYINIGIAVDTPKGLVVPVIRDADRRGIFELAQELAEMSARAREGRSRLDEFQGATFTISSLGGIGGTSFTPIVNSPEAAILGVSRMAWKQVYSDDGEFVPRRMLPRSLTYDHRVIDGAEAVRFTTYLGKLLGDIRKILL